METILTPLKDEVFEIGLKTKPQQELVNDFWDIWNKMHEVDFSSFEYAELEEMKDDVQFTLIKRFNHNIV